MVSVIALLVLFDAMSIPLFLTAAFVGLIVLVEMASPRYARPRWTNGLRRFVQFGFVVFGLYVAFRLALMVPAGAV